MPHSRLTKSLFAALAHSASAAIATLPSAAQEAPLFSQFDETSTAIVDTTPYGELINALTVTEKGRVLVAYDIAHARALPFFDQYKSYLEGVSVELLNRDEQLAFWLNTRNVVLLQALSEERRVSGFKNKRGTPDNPGAFWTQKRITVSGTELSLQDIEQDILFAGWDNPNIIYGLYQGISGGPILPREAFSGSNVHDQLQSAGRLFTAPPNNLRVRGSKIRISTYFDWYLNLAFGGDENTLRQHLAELSEPKDKALITETGTLTRKRLSTSFERYQARQESFSSSGRSVGGGYGS